MPDSLSEPYRPQRLCRPPDSHSAWFRSFRLFRLCPHYRCLPFRLCPLFRLYRLFRRLCPFHRRLPFRLCPLFRLYRLFRRLFPYYLYLFHRCLSFRLFRCPSFLPVSYP